MEVDACCFLHAGWFECSNRFPSSPKTGFVEDDILGTQNRSPSIGVPKCRLKNIIFLIMIITDLFRLYIIILFETLSTHAYILGSSYH